MENKPLDLAAFAAAEAASVEAPVVSSTVPTSTGTVITPNAQADLEKHLEEAATYVQGIEDLSAEMRDAVAAVLKTATALTKSTISSVLLYMHETGASSNLQPGAGARKQMALYRELQNYINNGPDDFRKGFGTILRIVAEQKKIGVFCPAYIFRFVKDMTGSNKERQGLELLFETLVALSNVSGRASAVKQVDLSKVSSTCFNAAGAQRFIGYFST